MLAAAPVLAQVEAGKEDSVRVEIWSDVACPWCYIGKRRFEAALAGFDGRDEVEVVWRAFELDPHAPREQQEDTAQLLATKYGMTREQALQSQAHVTELARREGLAYHLDRSRRGNTFDAHRLTHLGRSLGSEAAVVEALFAAYFTHGEPIGDPDALVRTVEAAGADPAEARAVLDGDRYAREVRQEEAEAAALGIRSVPSFVLDRRFLVTGAQAPEVLHRALESLWVRPAELRADERPLPRRSHES